MAGDDWATRKASIADILGHVGGLPMHDHSYRPGDAPEDVVRRMRELRTAYELREKWSYNNQVRPLSVGYWIPRRGVCRPSSFTVLHARGVHSFALREQDVR